MALPLALPLAPVVAPGATAAAATFVAGSSLALAETVVGFRRQAPTLPPITGAEGVATLQELIADAWAGARVPVANPVPPPFNSGGLGLAAAAAAGIWQLLKGPVDQLWGLLNGQPRGSNAPPAGFELVNLSGSFSPTGITTGTHTNTVFIGNIYSSFSDTCAPWESPNPSSGTWSIAGFTGAIRIHLSGATICGGSFSLQLQGFSATDNQWVNITAVSGGSVGWQTLRTSLSAQTTAADAQPFTYGTEPTPWVPPAIPRLDEASTSLAPSPQALTLPLPLPAYVPGATPLAEPAPSETPALLPPLRINPATGFGFRTWQNADGTQTNQWVYPQALSPEPALQPGTLPGSNVQPQGPAALPKLPTVFPSRPGTEPTTQTQPDGALAPTTTPPVVATDPGSIVPWPGAAPIPGTGPSPAPTLQGIAQEVGRIERKLEVMNTPNAPGNLVDKFGNLQDLLGPLVEAILAATSGTVYSLDSPCEVDAEGNRLPAVEVEAPGAVTQFGAILNRIDALADLLQVHKDLKQPNCRGLPLVGEFVTVNFEQID